MRVRLTVSIMIVIFTVFFYQSIIVQEHGHLVNETMKGGQDNSKREWGNTIQSIKHYTEITMPFHSEDYGEGIWNTMLDQDGRLFSFSENDKMEKNTLIFWNEKGQFEKAFPSAKSARKKTTKKYALVVPYSNGKKIKYLMYGSGKKEYFCYFLGKNGAFIREIKLQEFLEQAVKEGKIELAGEGNQKADVSCEIMDIIQTGKNRMVVILALHGEVGWDNDKSYLLDIDVKKRRLISVEKCDGWLVGADSRYRYGLRVEEEGYFSFDRDFSYGQFFWEDRKTGEQVAEGEIPNDIVLEEDPSASQCFDIRNGTVWLCNRTGFIASRREIPNGLW